MSSVSFQVRISTFRSLTLNRIWSFRCSTTGVKIFIQLSFKGVNLCFGTGTFLTSVGRDFLADDGPPDPEVSSTSIEEGISLSFSGVSWIFRFAGFALELLFDSVSVEVILKNFASQNATHN